MFGFAFIILGFVNLGILALFGVNIKSIYPDMIFGAIDNGILVFIALLGGKIAGCLFGTGLAIIFLWTIQIIF